MTATAKIRDMQSLHKQHVYAIGISIWSSCWIAILTAEEHVATCKIVLQRAFALAARRWQPQGGVLFVVTPRVVIRGVGSRSYVRYPAEYSRWTILRPTLLRLAMQRRLLLVCESYQM